MPVATEAMAETYEMKLARINKVRAEWAANDAKRDEGLTEPAEIKVYRDIPYGAYGVFNLLDVYRPVYAEGQKLPVIVNIHGGGFFYGDKELYRFYAMNLALGCGRQSFATVNINYRLVPDFVFPAPLEDIAAVMKWISENADAYLLDKNNVFVIGDSAGAQLASQYSAIFSNPGYAAEFGIVHPADVVIRGSSLACGMYDMVKRATERKPGSDDYLEGIAYNDPRLDVLKNIDSHYPAAYVFSGREDFLRSACEPMIAFINEHGGHASGKVYGLDSEFPAHHVFHVDLRNKLGMQANSDQISFFEANLN